MNRQLFIRRFIALSVIMGLVLVGLTTNTLSSLASAIQSNLASPATESQLPESIVNQVIVKDGVRVHFSSAEFASDATVLHLELGLDGASATPNTYLPIRPEQIQVHGISGDPKTFGQVAERPVDHGQLPVDLVVGPVSNPNAGASISITELDVLDQNGSYKSIFGPWLLTLSPDQIKIDPVDVTIPLQQTVQRNGIAINLLQAHLSSRAVSVRYTTSGLTDGQFIPANGSVIQMVLPDGETFSGSMQQGAGTSITDGVALFPPLPVGLKSFSLSFGPFIVVDPNPAQATFSIPPRVRTAPAGTFVAISRPFVLGTEQMQVVGISQKEGRITIVVSNADTAGQGRILFVGPDTDGQILVDDQGNSYSPLGGSTGLQRGAAGALSAGMSTIQFEGSIASDASTLTVREDHYGRMVSGPDPVTINIPVN